MTIQTQQPLVGQAFISYGYSLTPLADWVAGADGEGVAAAFGSIPLAAE